MTKKERMARILAVGETTNHCHIIVGDVDISTTDEGTVLMVGPDGALIRHVLQSAWVEKEEQVWTKEHKDITVEEGTYDMVPQINFDPLTKRVERARD